VGTPRTGEIVPRPFQVAFSVKQPRRWLRPRFRLRIEKPHVLVVAANGAFFAKSTGKLGRVAPKQDNGAAAIESSRMVPAWIWPRTFRLQQCPLRHVFVGEVQLIHEKRQKTGGVGEEVAKAEMIYYIFKGAREGCALLSRLTLYISLVGPFASLVTPPNI